MKREHNWVQELRPLVTKADILNIFCVGVRKCLHIHALHVKYNSPRELLYYHFRNQESFLPQITQMESSSVQSQTSTMQPQSPKHKIILSVLVSDNKGLGRRHKRLLCFLHVGTLGFILDTTQLPSTARSNSQLGVTSKLKITFSSHLGYQNKQTNKNLN